MRMERRLHRADREIFEADEPHRPVGCSAQAWSVAEVLRIAAQLEMVGRETERRRDAETK